MTFKNTTLSLLAFALITVGHAQKKFPNLESSKNSLNYKGNPIHATDRKSLAFSDKGAWFAFGFQEPLAAEAGFSGPLLLTEQNGVWSSSSLVSLHLRNADQKEIIDWKTALVSQTSYNSHLQQEFKNNELSIQQQIVFVSGHTALQKTTITNCSSQSLTLYPTFSSTLFLDNIQLTNEEGALKLTSTKGPAIGHIQFLKNNAAIEITKNAYLAKLEKIILAPKQSKEIIVSQTFIFPEYSWQKEKESLAKINFDKELKKVQKEKELQLAQLIAQKKDRYKDKTYSNLIAKLLLTLQNNTRIAAQGLQHEGVFPSYHYEWFNGFWAWDSWKHAAAIANYNPELAKNQIRALFDYQEPNGFIPDCIYRDHLIEQNNYRNTKSPLAAWAVWKTFEKSKDKKFLAEMYPKLKAYHNWWYKERDHDQDGLCEFGSTDGTLIAAKWESGMDNAVRFDNSTILKNSEGAYSINRESVDLNSFLYAEKQFLSNIASVLSLSKEAQTLKKEAILLKGQIQNQFWDQETAWFYDSTIDGTTLLKDMGCEGYLPIWAEVATPTQVKMAKENMMNPAIFNTFVPLPTLAANHPKFKPEGGYWRGPIWLDQSYFGIEGLYDYGYTNEADELAHKLIHNAEGVLQAGEPIRENYQPLTGKGLESLNFSWSAAHYLMLLLKD